MENAKILQEIIDLEKRSYELKRKLGIYAFTESLRIIQMEAKDFKKIFKNFTIDESDKDYTQYKTTEAGYEIVALEEKESSQNDNGN